jgi:hypothetical protein
VLKVGLPAWELQVREILERVYGVPSRLAQHLATELGRVTWTSGAHYAPVVVDGPRITFVHHYRKIMAVVDLAKDEVRVYDNEYGTGEVVLPLHLFPDFKRFAEFVSSYVKQFGRLDVKDIVFRYLTLHTR